MMLLKKIGKISTGNTPSKKHREYYNSDDIGFVKPDSISDTVITEINKTSSFISENAREKARVAPKGSILITCIGSVGKVGIVTEGEYAFNQQINAIMPNKDVNQKYLAYNLLYNKQRLINIANAPVVPIVNKTQLENFEIKFDSNIDAQKKIVEQLDGIALVIDKRKKQFDALDELIKARFIEVFGDAIHNPMEWPVKKLGELSSQINSGNTPKGGQQVYVDKGITFFRSQNVWKNKLEMDDIAYIDEATHASMSRSSLKHGDILMTKTGRINTENSSLGRAALYMGKDEAANVNGHVYFIRLKPGINNKFILRILISDEYRDYIRSVCVGGIDKRQLNKEHIEDFPIICPPVKLIEKYIAFTEQADKSKAVIEKSLKELETLQASLMQKYFS